MSENLYELTPDELSEIRELYEKKLALENLAKILSPEENQAMYQRLVADYGAAVHLFNDWWEKTFRSHALPPADYSVDFENSRLIPAAQG